MSDHLSAGADVIGEHLSPGQVRSLAVKHAAPSATMESIAEIADVGVASLYRWLKLPRFHECWVNVDVRVREITRGLRTDLEIRSLRTLIDMQDASEAAAAVKVDAASKGLTHVQRAREHETPSADSQLAAMMKGWAEEGRRERESLLKEEGRSVDSTGVLEE